MRIASWNVNSLRVRLDQVLAWLDTAKPDVLGLQETKLIDEKFPREEFAARGYHVACSGQPTYNGVALISRQSIEETMTDFDGYADAQRRILGATIGPIRILNLYVPNGQSVDSDKYEYKLAWLAALKSQLQRELARYEHIVVMGDFNIAPADADVHDPVAWEGKVLCSAKERRALTELLDLGFEDTYRLFERTEQEFSWWDYRAAAFRRNLGLRIDLVLASKRLSAACSEAAIDAAPRRNERPSDHAPVYAQFTLEC